MAPSIIVLLSFLAGISAAGLVAFVSSRLATRRKDTIEASELVTQAREARTIPVVTGAVSIVRPQSHTVEGLEIQYGAQGLVRSVRVGAMNVEHKELLLVMDSVVWEPLPNAQKQEVLAVARSTWAAKMCPDGPDIAYVIVKTELGRVVGRADPRAVTLV